MNTTIKVADAVIQGLVYDVALKAVEAEIIVQVPFLALPVINQVFTFIMTQIASMFYTQLSKVVNFSIIDLQTEVQQQQYEKSVTKLKTELDKPKEKQDEKAINEASDAVKKHLADLIHFNH